MSVEFPVSHEVIQQRIKLFGRRHARRFWGAYQDYYPEHNEGALVKQFAQNPRSAVNYLMLPFLFPDIIVPIEEGEINLIMQGNGKELLPFIYSDSGKIRPLIEDVFRTCLDAGETYDYGHLHNQPINQSLIKLYDKSQQLVVTSFSSPSINLLSEPQNLFKAGCAVSYMNSYFKGVNAHTPSDFWFISSLDSYTGGVAAILRERT